MWSDRRLRRYALGATMFLIQPGRDRLLYRKRWRSPVHRDFSTHRHLVARIALANAFLGCPANRLLFQLNVISCNCRTDLNVCTHNKKDGISRCEYLIHPVTVNAVSLLGLPCIHTPHLLDTTTTCLGSDNCGMLEAWKHITWPIHCSQTGKQPGIE